MEGSESDEDRSEMVLMEQQDSEHNSSEDEEQFDITLAASHSYMGPEMVCVSGRSVLEPGWKGKIPVMAHHGTVFPGETVPMLLTHIQDMDLMERALEKDKLFGLLCPNETGALVSGYGVACEVFEAGVRRRDAGLSFKARATQRFRLLAPPRTPPPLPLFSHLQVKQIQVLPELESTEPLQAARLNSLDSLRRGRKQLDRRLRSMDAMLTPWPLFLYDIFDFQRMRELIRDYFKQMMFESLPAEPVALSFWVASNLPLSARDRLALFTADHALLRLHMELAFIHRKSALCCVSCMNEIARREHVFAMSSDGAHSNYTNLGGYMHDLVTVTSVRRVELSGGPSAQYSWFPGYSWCVALCGRCTKHVGWRFDALKRNLRPRRFYGLCRNNVQPRNDVPEPSPELSPTSPLTPDPLPLPGDRTPELRLLATDDDNSLSEQ